MNVDEERQDGRIRASARRWGRPLTTLFFGGFMTVMSAVAAGALWVVIGLASNSVTATGLNFFTSIVSGDSASVSGSTPLWLSVGFVVACLGVAVGALMMCLGAGWTLLTAGRVARDSEFTETAIERGRDLGEAGIEAGRDLGAKSLDIGSKGVDLGAKGITSGRRTVQGFWARRSGGAPQLSPAPVPAITGGEPSDLGVTGPAGSGLGTDEQLLS